MTKFFLLGIIILTIILGCRSSAKMDNNKEVLRGEVDKYGLSKYGEKYELLYSPKEDFVIVLVKHRRNHTDPFPTIQFEILKVENLEKLFGDSVRMGKVTWTEDHIVSVKSNQALPKSDGKIKKLAYFFNVKTKQKYTKGFFNLKNK